MLLAWTAPTDGSITFFSLQRKRLSDERTSGLWRTDEVSAAERDFAGRVVMLDDD